MKKISCIAALFLALTSVLTYGQYITLNGTYTNYTFHAGTTYYISGSVACYGTVTFEGGAVLKYATTGSITVTPGPVGSAQINWKADANNPVFFTAKDDNTVGQTISGSTGNPGANMGGGGGGGGYGNPMLLLGAVPSAQTITGLRMSYAGTGIYLGASSATIYDAQFMTCLTDLKIGGGTAWVNNSLFAGAMTNCSILGNATLNAQNVTFANSMVLAGGTSSGCNVTLVNCILASIGSPISGVFASISGNYNGYYNCSVVPGFGANTTTSSSNPFKIAGADKFYLVNGCNFRNQGTTAINSTLLAEIQKFTTYAPQDGSIPDNDGYPDLGYHYPLLPYVTLNGSYTNYTFQACTTYYISGPVVFFGTVTFEGGAVLKYATNSSITVTPGPFGSAQIYWSADACNPVFFTAKDDNTVGQTIVGSTGNPGANMGGGSGIGGYGNPMLLLGSVPSWQTISGLRMSYAGTGIYLGASSATIYDAQFESCLTDLKVGGGTTWVYNCLFADSMTNLSFLGNATLNAQNVTFTNSRVLAGGTSFQTGCNIMLEYCILANIGSPITGVFASISGDHNGYYNCPVVPGFGPNDGDPGLGYQAPVDCISGNSQSPMTGSGNPGIPVTIVLSANVACDSTLTYSIAPGTGPANGVLGPITRIDAKTESVIYTPNNNFEGIDSFSFTVTDGIFISQPANATIFVVRGPILTAACLPDAIELNWNLDAIVQQMQNISPPLTIFDFQIYRSTTPGGPYTTPIGNAPGNVNDYVDFNVAPNTTYYYKVTFRYQDPDSGTIYESPYNEASSSTCQPPPPPPCVMRSGFDSQFLDRNDDLSTALITLPMTINFYGTSYSQLYVNNNGNVTFAGPLGTYTPTTGPLSQEASQESGDIIAPFWADVDTDNPGSDVVRYGVGSANGKNAFGVEWANVGYFNDHADKLVSVQMVFIDRSDVAPGDFDMEFNYCTVQWEAGDVSGGRGGYWTGPGGEPARAGFAQANGAAFEFNGSGVERGLLDVNPITGLIWNSFNSGGNLGRYVFQFRNGTPLGLP